MRDARFDEAAALAAERDAPRPRRSARRPPRTARRWSCSPPLQEQLVIEFTLARDAAARELAALRRGRGAVRGYRSAAGGRRPGMARRGRGLTAALKSPARRADHREQSPRIRRRCAVHGRTRPFPERNRPRAVRHHPARARAHHPGCRPPPDGAGRQPRQREHARLPAGGRRLPQRPRARAGLGGDPRDASSGRASPPRRTAPARCAPTAPPSTPTRRPPSSRPTRSSTRPPSRSRPRATRILQTAMGVR